MVIITQQPMQMLQNSDRKFFFFILSLITSYLFFCISIDFIYSHVLYCMSNRVNDDDDKSTKYLCVIDARLSPLVEHWLVNKLWV